jgi:sulfur carrier protein
MQIVLNGEGRKIASGLTIAGLLQQLQLTTGRIAVELNQQIVPRAEHESTELSDGDKVEIVSFVGGG